MTWG